MVGGWERKVKRKYIFVKYFIKKFPQKKQNSSNYIHNTNKLFFNVGKKLGINILMGLAYSNVYGKTIN